MSDRDLERFRTLVNVSKDEDYDFLVRTVEINRVQICPALIWRRSTGEEIHTRWKLQARHFFTPDQINDIALEVNRLLLMQDTYLFASRR